MTGLKDGTPPLQNVPENELSWLRRRPHPRVVYVVSDGDCIRGSGGYIHHLTTRPTHIRPRGAPCGSRCRRLVACGTSHRARPRPRRASASRAARPGRGRCWARCTSSRRDRHRRRAPARENRSGTRSDRVRRHVVGLGGNLEFPGVQIAKRTPGSVKLTWVFPVVAENELSA